MTPWTGNTSSQVAEPRFIAQNYFDSGSICDEFQLPMPK